MASGHLLLSCAKRTATTKIDLFAYLWQLPCALCSLILMTLPLNSTLRQLGKRLPKVAETLENTGEIIVILKGAACHIKAPKSYGFGAFSLFFGSKSSTYHAKI